MACFQRHPPTLTEGVEVRGEGGMKWQLDGKMNGTRKRNDRKKGGDKVRT
jgi:hypothetical protein